ncbi:hypothetical protein [Halomonas sp. Mc5H-6]|uniref:hypothetical protein n=1 Tax=Halomonas sp. Mc5H-6 TaxID=2954500 RepID=UPI002097A989|nr:hypothetical protein [Halomonas sp. Mc5H-6]MCO7247517.1 hypothetical protein [Halomonas sp. Mc5H-6]
MTPFDSKWAVTVVAALLSLKKAGRLPKMQNSMLSRAGAAVKQSAQLRQAKSIQLEGIKTAFLCNSPMIMYQQISSKPVTGWHFSATARLNAHFL